MMPRKLLPTFVAWTASTCLLFMFNNCSRGFKTAEIQSLASGSLSPAPAPAPAPLPIVDVAVGSGGLRISSIDKGKTWQYTSEAVLSNDCWGYRNLVYGKGLFVAVTGTGGFGRISTSPDGVHWREYESQYGSDGLAYGGGQFITENWKSSDGYNFTFRTTDAAVGSHQQIAYMNGNWIMSGDQNGIAVSTDGDHFTTKLANYTSPDYLPFFSNMQMFAAGNNIVVGISYMRIATSSDSGMTWTNQDDFFGYGAASPTTAYQYNTFRSIVFDGTKFIIFGGSGAYGNTPTMWTSADGLTWTQSNTPSNAYMVGGLPGSHLFGFVKSSTAWTQPANILSSWDNGVTWVGATLFELSSFYDFSTATAPLAPPTISDFSSYGLSHAVSGQASSDPTTTTPTMPDSVVYTHAQLSATACAPDYPIGR